MYCQVNGVEVAYQEFGAGYPLLFLHGWSLDHRYEQADYEPVFAASPGWRRIYLDLPGMGETVAPPWLCSLDQMLTIVLGFIDRLLPQRRFAIAGTSAGAYLARGVVAQRQAQLDGVLLRVPLILPDYHQRDLPAARTLLSDPAALDALTPAERDALGMPLVQSPGYLAQLRAKFHTTVQPALQCANQPLLQRIAQDQRSFALSCAADQAQQRCEAPALFVLGRQDVAVGYRDAWSLLEHFPRASFAVLDRADHLLPIEQASLFAALVQDWLWRVAEYAALPQG